MKCFHHNDLDGRAAAVAVLDNFGDYVETCQINYNIPFPFDQIEKTEAVFIVDYSIKPEEMERLLKITKAVTWIDHHKTAIAKYEDFPHKVKGYRSTKYAGCVLTWIYLNKMLPDKLEPTDEQLEEWYKDVPHFLKLIGDYDTWTFAFPETNAFHYGALRYDTEPKSEFWHRCVDRSTVVKVGNEGSIVLQYRDQWAKDYMKSWAYEVEFEGCTGIAANLAQCGSQYFESFEDKYDLMLPFVWDGKQWTVSLYTTREHIDVSEIAKKYGGGGHKGAAGFQCATLPFKPKE